MLKKLSTLVFAIVVLFAIIGCQMTGSTTSEITISFDSAGGTTVESIEYSEGEVIVQPADPTREGYIFLGWYLDDQLFDFETVELTESITLVAKWEEEIVVQSYTVTLYLNVDGSESQYEVIEFTDYQEVTLPTPVKEGYVFLGWYSGEDRIDHISENINYVLYGELAKEEESYSVTLTINDPVTGLVQVETINFIDCSEVALPELDYSSKGFIFLGWYEGEEVVTVITENRNYELTAVFEAKQYKITFSVNGGTCDVKELTFTNYEDVVLPIPTRDGYDFIGWYNGYGELVEKITENKTYALTAKWDGQIRSISYVLNGGAFEGEYPTEHKIGKTTILVNPVQEGYRFVGWYKTSNFSGSSLNRIAGTNKEDITLYAKWEVQLPTITYVLNGGNWKYSSREEMVDDFLTDVMAWGGKTKRPDGMVQGAGATQVGFANVFSSVYGFFSSSAYQAKWAWLHEYIINVTSVSGSKSYLQQGNEAYWRYSLGAFLFEEHRAAYPISEDYTKDAAANGFWDTLSAHEECEYEYNGEILTPVKIYYIFDGWYDNPEFTGDKVTSISKTTTLYAKWNEEVPVNSISITNKVTELDRFEEYQLTWELNPTNAAIKSVEFYTSDKNIATVSETGLITPLNNGTVTITIKSLSPTGVTDSITINVTSPSHFDVSYATESYVGIGDEITLIANYFNRDGSLASLIFESMTPSIATVDAKGVVSGVAEGVATIRVSLEDNSDVYFEFIVTVLTEELASELQFVVDSHESNVFTRYDLGIGAGTPVYYSDILGSVSSMLYNYDMFYNTKHLAACMANGQYSNGLTKVEFITVHYTAGMTKGSNAEATAKFFSGNSGASAHFCTGNDGVFQTLDLDVRGWHAGDGASATFTWNPTGVKYNSNDPQWPVWGISSNAKFTINGQETSIKVPYKEQRGSEGYVTDDKWLNDQGFAFKVVDGEYYMGTTWWCYSNVWEGRICSRGGNKHSIGIESAVDFGSDLWLTWQITAKLVAELMIKYNLDITRVVGHHFFAAKDCPQPLLENDLEIWWEFIEMVKTEHEAMTAQKNVEFEFEVVSGSDVIDDNGRVIAQPEYSTSVSYKVTTSSGKSITLGSIVPGIYTK